MMEFSERVLLVRAKLNLSQIDLSKELGVSNVTINRWEKGVCKPSYLAKVQFDNYCKKKGVEFKD